MRNGLYATVSGKEYAAQKQPDGTYRIFSEQEEDGFSWDGQRWSRSVQKDEISRMVSVKTVGVLGASRMTVYPVDGETCRVVTANKELAEVLGMEKLGRAEFQKNVPVEKLKSITEIVEEVSL